jgi:hypothetical protein
MITRRRPSRREMNLEILIGALGLFSCIALVATVRTELRGESALSQALVLLCLVVCLYVVIRIRRSL